MTQIRLFLRLFALLCAIVFMCAGTPERAYAQETQAETEQAQSEQTEPTPKTDEEVEAEAKAESEALESRTQIKNSLLSLSETLESRRTRIAELSRDLQRTRDETEQASLQAEIDELKAEISQVQDEIEIVVLGLQSREYAEIGNSPTETDQFDLGTEVGRIFQPLVISLKRATEPSRRMEELRQLSSRTQRRQEVAQATLDHIGQFRQDEVTYPAEIEERLTAYEEAWKTRFQESVDLGNALQQQLDAAQRAQGNTFTQFTDDFGSFIINRGANLLMALGSAIAFFVLCQLLRVGLINFYRTKRTGVLSAPIRIIGMVISFIGIIGALMIAITIFNIRHDWLMLAMSLLLALAISWSFVKALPTLLEEMRVLLNLGSVREGERTIVNGLPYRIERLSIYSKLVNPALQGGSLVFPVRELINMHSRPITEGEAWFPTEIGDWIVRDGQNYEIVNQSPEHVIMRRPGGSEDFVPVAEFLDTLFISLSSGYRRTHVVGLSYDHLDIASDHIPGILSKSVYKRIAARIGEEAILNIETRLLDLGDSSLDFKVLVDIGPDQGQHWQPIQTDIANGVVDACLANGWKIPFPQLVVHKGG